ncbi:hypothetical protein BJ741DRAFT_596158, partial [Chytriomyces cf. hyalinus JEL632]
MWRLWSFDADQLLFGYVAAVEDVGPLIKQSQLESVGLIGLFRRYGQEFILTTPCLDCARTADNDGSEDGDDEAGWDALATVMRVLVSVSVSVSVLSVQFEWVLVQSAQMRLRIVGVGDTACSGSARGSCFAFWRVDRRNSMQVGINGTLL